MSNKDYIELTGDQIAFVIDDIGAFLPYQNITESPVVPIDELREFSSIIQTPIEEIFKPIKFPYWSL